MEIIVAIDLIGGNYCNKLSLKAVCDEKSVGVFEIRARANHILAHPLTLVLCIMTSRKGFARGNECNRHSQKSAAAADDDSAASGSERLSQG